MGIPVIGQAAGIVALAENNDAIIIDGDDGQVHLRPIMDLQRAYEEKVRLRARRQEQFRALRSVDPITKDGQFINLKMNAGLLVDLPQLAESGADGIGLFRTELQFMIASTMPKGEEQEAFYRSVLRNAKGKPVTFRTLDIGGDKVVSYMRGQEEENPALGWRAIRLSLDRPGLLRTQMRALLRAASGAELKMMLPMITEVSEIHAVRELMQKEIQHLSKFGHALPRKLQFGAMLEVPALLWQLDELMQEVDFVSVGSNDLFQFSMAVDRGNARVSDRFDILGKPFLRILRDIVRAGERNNKPVTLCGEMAGRPLSAMALIGLGFRSVSMSPTSIGPVKAMLLGLDVGALSVELNAALDDHKSLESPRVLLQRFAAEHSIPV
jgi:phosphotransferase system enzyme I (PtsP)